MTLHDTARVRASTRAMISSTLGPAPDHATQRTSAPMWRRWFQMYASDGNSLSGTTMLSPGRQSMPLAAMFMPCDVLLVKMISSGLALISLASLARAASSGDGTARYLSVPGNCLMCAVCSMAATVRLGSGVTAAVFRYVYSLTSGNSRSRTFASVTGSVVDISTSQLDGFRVGGRVTP